MNTKPAGFLPLPGPDLVKGLWSYEVNGRRYCLQTRGKQGLSILDMTDTGNPVEVQNVPGDYRNVRTLGNYAYATDDEGPTSIIDLSDPSKASVVATAPIGSHTLRLDESNGRLYLNRNGILDAYDLNKDPLKPEYLGSWSAGAHDSRPAGDVLYTHGFNQVPGRILDVSDPANMKQIGTLPYGNHSGDVYYTPDGRTILLALTEAYSGHVKLYDVTDPSQPTEISSYQSGPFVSVHNVEVKGAYAYVAYYQDQLRILDLTDVTNPVEVGVWDNNPANRGGLFSDAWETIPFHDAVYMNQMDDNVSGPKGTYAIDFFPAFGTAAAGAGGVEPEMWWSFGPPSPGNDRFELRLENGPPHRRFWLLVGQSQTEWRGQPLPQPMSWIGAPNAQLQVSPDFVIPGATNGSGQATISLPVPEGMPYSVFYAQIVVKDPGAPNAGGFSSTRPGKLVVW